MMEVVTTRETVDFVRERGGQLFVWTHKGG